MQFGVCTKNGLIVRHFIVCSKLLKEANYFDSVLTNCANRPQRYVKKDHGIKGFKDFTEKGDFIQFFRGGSVNANLFDKEYDGK